jgi:hypothetical protein
MIEIPLNGGAENAHQQFSAMIDNVYLTFVIDYLSYVDTPGWSMNIIRDGLTIVSGAMLVPGADVIATYKAGIGRFIFSGAEPTLDNLGVANNLTWVIE